MSLKLSVAKASAPVLSPRSAIRILTSCLIAGALSACQMGNGTTGPGNSPSPGVTPASPSPGSTASPAANPGAGPAASPSPAPSASGSGPASPLPSGQIQRLELGLSSRFLNGSGESLQIQLSAFDADGKPAALNPSALQWRSSRPQDISVDANGRVTALAEEGFAEISASLPGGPEAKVLVSVSSGEHSSGSSGGGGGGSGPRLPRPAIASVTPEGVAIGAEITVTGEHLDTVSSVRIDGAPARFTIVSASELQVLIPAGPGTGSLSVSNGSGSATGSVVLTNRAWFVDEDARGDDDGSSWKDAFDRVQEALAVAAEDDLIWVAEGVYLASYTGDRAESFVVPADFELTGGFDASELYLDERELSTVNGIQQPVQETILSGDLDDNDNYGLVPFTGTGENSRHVLRHGANVSLDGFVIEGGAADLDEANADEQIDLEDQGAGIDSGTSSLTLLNSSVRNNLSVEQGAGIYSNSAALSIHNVSFSNNLSDSGAAIRNITGALTLTDVRFEANRSYNFAAMEDGGDGGAGIHNESGALTLTRAAFVNNTANGGGGGGLRNGTGALTISNSSFTGNQANGAGGGGIRNGNGSLTITNSIFSGNSASGACGGGIRSQNGNLTLSGGSFSNNLANGNAEAPLSDGGGGGGGIRANNGSLSISNVSFSGNQANGQGDANDAGSADDLEASGGGAIRKNGGSLTINGSSFSNNQALGSLNAGGSAIRVDGGTVNIGTNTFTGNTHSKGALRLVAGTVTVTGSTFSENEATVSGGAIYTGELRELDADPVLTLSLNSVNLLGNSATFSGGAVYSAFGTVNLVAPTCRGNAAGLDGGCIWNQDGRTSASFGYFVTNTAGNNGGAVYLDNPTVGSSFINIVFAANQASQDGGGIYNADAGSVGAFHVTFSDNSAGSDADAVYMNAGRLLSGATILWDEQALPLFFNTGASLRSRDSLIRDLTSYAGVLDDDGNNFDDNPDFIDVSDITDLDQAGNGLELQPGSPAIGAEPEDGPVPQDILFRARPEPHDLGAYESQDVAD